MAHVHNKIQLHNGLRYVPTWRFDQAADPQVVAALAEADAAVAALTVPADLTSVHPTFSALTPAQLFRAERSHLRESLLLDDAGLSLSAEETAFAAEHNGELPTSAGAGAALEGRRREDARRAAGLRCAVVEGRDFALRLRTAALEATRRVRRRSTDPPPPPEVEGAADVGNWEAWEALLRRLNAAVVHADDLPSGTAEPGEYAAHYRYTGTADGPLLFAFPQQVPHLVRELSKFLHEYGGPGVPAGNAAPRLHPIVVAAMAHFVFCRVHPFTAANGRVARVVANTVLQAWGYPPAIFPVALCEPYMAALHARGTDDYAAMVVFVAACVRATANGLSVEDHRG